MNGNSCFLLVLLLGAAGTCFARTRCVIATGKLNCTSDPTNAENVEIKLMDWDGDWFLDPDDQMGIGYSDEDGSFKVEGCGYDFGPWNDPDPYLKIFHHCNAPKGREIKTKIQRVFRPETNDFGVIRLD